MKTYRLLALLFLFVSCGPDSEPNPEYRLSLFRMKQDYSRYVFAGLSDDKTHFVYYHGPYCEDDTLWPMPLTNGYYIDEGQGSTWHEKSVPTALKIADYMCEMTTEEQKRADSIYHSLNSILDMDPFTEYYVGDSRDFEGEKGGLDTAKINKVIREGKLKKYFYRKK